jgi:hypothetical protein
MISPDGIVTTISGTANANWRDGPARASWINGPTDVQIDNAGNLYVPELYRQRIRKLSLFGDATAPCSKSSPSQSSTIPSTTAEAVAPIVDNYPAYIEGCTGQYRGFLVSVLKQNATKQSEYSSPCYSFKTTLNQSVTWNAAATTVKSGLQMNGTVDGDVTVVLITSNPRLISSANLLTDSLDINDTTVLLKRIFRVGDGITISAVNGNGSLSGNLLVYSSAKVYVGTSRFTVNMDGLAANAMLLPGATFDYVTSQVRGVQVSRSSKWQQSDHA